MRTLSALEHLPWLSLLLALWACGDGETPPPLTVLEVQVVDRAISAPIAEAELRLGGLGDGRWTALDGEGSLRLEDASVGAYTVQVQAPGYVRFPIPGGVESPEVGSVVVVANETTKLVVMMDALPSGWAGTGVIRGVVRKEGAPVADVLVTAAATLEASGLTDVDGRFTLFDLTAGSYRIEAYRAGAAFTPLTAQPLEAGGSLEVELTGSAQDGGSLEGRLVGTDPVTSELFLTLASSGDRLSDVGTTAELGAVFSIAGIPAAEVRLDGLLELDGWVIDPDLIRQKVDLVADLRSGGQVMLGDVPIAPAVDLVRPVDTATLADAFEWSAFPGADFFVIEVADVTQDVIWGGFDAGGNPKFRILASQTQIAFGAQGTPTEGLRAGSTYFWRVYAGEDVTTGEVFKLLGASERRLGMFRTTP